MAKKRFTGTLMDVPFTDVELREGLAEKYLSLAERILTGTQADLSAREICDYASLNGHMKGLPERLSQWRSLLYYLKAETDKSATRFCCIPGVPVRFGLKRELGGLEKMWEQLNAETKEAEKLGMAYLLTKISEFDNSKPKFRQVLKNEPVRNPNVRAYVRLRAKHCCELCGWEGFEEDDGSLYIEVHHLKWLAEGGSDTPDNAAALCPNCHRELHHGKMRKTRLRQLKRNIEEAKSRRTMQ